MWLALCISLLAQAPDARVEVIEPGPPGTQYQRSVVHSRDTDYVLVPVPREAPCLVIYISTAGRPVVAQRKCAITIPAAQVGTGGVTDFSVLLTRSAFPDEMCSPTDPNAAQANGGDIRFYSDAALTSRLACDLIAWELDSSDGARDAAIQIRVLVPSLSSVVANTIYVSYNAGESETQPAAGEAYGQYAAYDSAVETYHPLEESSGTLYDRTGAYDGTAAGTLTYGASGKVGKAATFSGDDVITAANALALTAPFTVAAWINNTALGRNTLWSKRGNQISTTSAAFGQENIYAVYDTNGTDGASRSADIKALMQAGWVHVAVVFGGSAPLIYINGAETTYYSQTSPTGTEIATGGYDLKLGDSTFSNDKWVGGMDDAQLHSVARSAAWITTEYNQTNDPARFAVPGTPETVGGGAGIAPLAMYYRRRRRAA